MKYITIPFRATHVRMMKLSTRQEAMFRASPEILPILENLGGETALFDAVPKVCWGIGQLWRGVYEVWAIVDISLGASLAERLTLHRGALKVLASVPEDAWRLQATVSADDSSAIRWAERLGFVCEGKMRYFGADQTDYLMLRHVGICEKAVRVKEGPSPATGVAGTDTGARGSPGNGSARKGS